MCLDGTSSGATSSVNDLYEKLASSESRVARRLMDVSKELAEGPARRPGLLSSAIPSWFAQLATGMGGAAAETVPQVAAAGARGTGKALDVALQPGSQSALSPVYGGVADAVSSRMTLPRALVGGAVLSIPFAADEAYLNSSTVAPLAQAQATGENLMTDPFTSFVQKRAAEKTAVKSLPRAFGHGIDVLGDLVGDLVSSPGAKVPRTFVDKGVLRNVTDAAGNIAMEAGPRQFSPGKAMALAGGAAALGAGADILQGDAAVGPGLEYQLAKKYIPIEDRIQATDTAAASFLSQSGKNMANLLDEAIREGVNVGATAAVHHNRSFDQDVQFQNAMQSDPLLSQATPEDKDMLRRSFNSMTRFSPDLATDEFAVKNFLRESMLAANGPDYATLGQMARVNESIAPQVLLPQKTKAPI